MANDGQGTTIVFGTSSFAGELISIDGWARARDFFETSHMGTTTAKTFSPADLQDPGEISGVFEFEGADAPPIGAVAETITVTWGGSGSWAASGFMTAFEPQAQMGERMTASFTLKLSGAVS